MVDYNTTTTIQLKKQTREKLEDLKTIPRETYDAVINRMIIKYNGGV